MFLQFFSWLQNQEVLKSALIKFSIAINQAFVNLTQKLCQGVQQQEAHAEGGHAGHSTSKGTREVRSKRKYVILEESLGEIRSDEEDSSSNEDYANFDSCDTEGDEDDDHNDGGSNDGANDRKKTNKAEPASKQSDMQLVLKASNNLYWFSSIFSFWRQQQLMFYVFLSIC